MKYIQLTLVFLLLTVLSASAQMGTNADGRREIFVLGGDRGIWHKWQLVPNGSWGEWSSLGGTELRQVSTASNADGRQEIFAVGGDRSLWHKWQTTPNGGWGEWASLAGIDLHQITLNSNADGRLEVFAIGGDRSLWHIWQTAPNSGWGQWSSLGGTDLLQIVTGKNADGRLEIFALGGDGAAWHKWQSSPNGSWGEWSSLGGTKLQQIVVGKNADGRLELFALGGDGGLWHIWQSIPNGGWGTWSSLGGTELKQIAINHNADGRLELSALGGNAGAWHIWQTTPNGGWGGWNSQGGTDLQQITTGTNADGREELFALGGDGGIWHKWQTSVNGPWGEWSSLGGTNLLEITNIIAVDRDHDGIDDDDERFLLKRFRPYYKFSNAPGVEDERPADAKWFVQHSELYDHRTEEGTPIFSNSQLSRDPSLILLANNKGPSDVRKNRNKSDYCINLANEFRGGDPDWNHIMKAAVGLYGHVAPLHEDGGHPQRITSYKIEYWQFYAHDNAGAGIASIHEGDWEAVQLVVESDEHTIRTVIHNIHDTQARYNFASGKRVDLGNGMIEMRGPNSPDPDVYINVDHGAAQNSLLRLYCENGECTHPVAYIEHGGHASWPTEKWKWVGVDNHNGTSYSYLVATPPNLGELGYANPSCPGSDLVLYFNGHWGAFMDGPEGPTVKTGEWGKK